ncbi:hypothetical protein QE152_g35788 [Popillia japonica]|uniref:Uncharacterized protein n=1 Tax=Popillia japonica TaxID=7064 RepID=A0AAW1IEU9_POPJA
MKLKQEIPKIKTTTRDVIRYNINKLGDASSSYFGKEMTRHLERDQQDHHGVSIEEEWSQIETAMVATTLRARRNRLRKTGLMKNAYKY